MGTKREPNPDDAPYRKPHPSETPPYPPKPQPKLAKGPNSVNEEPKTRRA